MTGGAGYIKEHLSHCIQHSLPSQYRQRCSPSFCQDLILVNRVDGWVPLKKKKKRKKSFVQKKRCPIDPYPHAPYDHPHSLDPFLSDTRLKEQNHSHHVLKIATLDPIVAGPSGNTMDYCRRSGIERSLETAKASSGFAKHGDDAMSKLGSGVPPTQNLMLLRLMSCRCRHGLVFFRMHSDAKRWWPVRRIVSQHHKATRRESQGYPYHFGTDTAMNASRYPGHENSMANHIWHCPFAWRRRRHGVWCRQSAGTIAPCDLLISSLYVAARSQDNGMVG